VTRGGEAASGPVPTVSVVLASRNRRAMLRPFVEALVGDPGLAEVVVVLDGDVDGSTECLEQLAREYPVVVPVVAEHRGQSPALELGVQWCRSEVVLLMDDDVVATPGLVSGHARRHAGQSGLVVLGYMPVQMGDTASAATRLYAHEYEDHCDRLEAGEISMLEGLWMGNLSAQRDDLLRVGIVSDDFTVRWHADTDLGLRLRAAGLRGVFDRSLRATHMHTRTAEAFLRVAAESGQGAWLLEHQHPDDASPTRTASLFEGLSSPMRALVSFLGRGERARWSSRALMSIGGGAERLGWRGLSTTLAKVARRVRIVDGYRQAEVVGT
jgi:GT2 family glycosyltransferase